MSLPICGSCAPQATQPQTSCSSCPQTAGGGAEAGATGGSGDLIKLLQGLLKQLMGEGSGGAGPAKEGRPTGNDFSKTLFGDQSQSWDAFSQRTNAGFHMMTMDLMGQQAGRSGGFF